MFSSCETARDLGVTQKTAWLMNHRLRFALTDGGFGLLSGEVEGDETFIGGKARNMHANKRAAKITGTGATDKTAVMGILERGGKIRTAVVPSLPSSHTEDARSVVALGILGYRTAMRSAQSIWNHRRWLDRREGPERRLGYGRTVQ